MNNSLEDFEHVKSRIKQEGFHYCFNSYSNFKEIDDVKFHKLRTDYLEAVKELEVYIDNKIIELENE